MQRSRFAAEQREAFTSFSAPPSCREKVAMDFMHFLFPVPFFDSLKRFEESETCCARFSLSKNAHQARAEMGVLEYKRVKNEKNAKKREGWLSLHFLFANFLRFMAANLSLTQLETWARPR